MDAVSTNRPAPNWARWALWPAIYLALRLAAPFIRMPHPALGNLVATIVFLLLPLLWLRTISVGKVHPAVGVALFLVFAVVWGELVLGMPFGVLAHVPWKAHPMALDALRLTFRPFGDVALITAAALLGAALAGIISDPKMLLPVALVGGLVDYWGVYYGTTHAFLQAAPDFVRSASVGIPSFGGGFTATGLRPVSFVGFGDWVFLAMFLTVAARYDLSPRRTFWVLLGFLVPAMLLVLFGVVDTLPAVVPMALAIFTVNGRRLKLSRSEALSTLIAVALVVCAIAAYMLALQRLHH
ncbi:MAG TPA: hypothetical protein VGM37_09930 [Armatimonadota bacterium]|jgi:hypothetical protein